MSDTPEKKAKPDFNVFAKVPVGVESRIGAQIGVAWRHKDGQGLNIILDAQPIPFDGRIELIAFPSVEKD